MHKVSFSTYIHRKLQDFDGRKEPGPYITISRQPGCEGYKVGDLLLELCNKRDTQQRWRLYKKEILRQLAQDTELAEELIDRGRHAAPNLLREFFRSLSPGGIPDGYEIRSKITNMVRMVAFEGYAIIIGQGGTAAASDIPNGLSIRLEAPMEWRVARVCARDNLSREQAIAHIKSEEEKRAYLRKLYQQENPHIPAFNITIDNSFFTAEQIAEIIYGTMKLKKMLS